MPGRRLLVLVLLCCGFASAGRAVVPDPTFSHCDAALSFNAQGACAYTVYVRDQFNNPVDSSRVTIDFGTCSQDTLLAVQDSGFTVSGNTISGMTKNAPPGQYSQWGNLTFHVRGRGSSSSCAVKVYAALPANPSFKILICTRYGFQACTLTPVPGTTWGRVRTIYR